METPLSSKEISRRRLSFDSHVNLEKKVTDEYSYVFQSLISLENNLLIAGSSQWPSFYFFYI